MQKKNSQQKEQKSQSPIKSESVQKKVSGPVTAAVQEKPQKPKIEVQITQNTSMKVPRVTTQNIICVVLILLVIPCAIIYTNSDWIPTANYHSEKFDFQVYCPVYYDLNYQLRQERDATFTGYIMQHLYSLADKLTIYAQLHGKQQKNIYVIKVMDGDNQTNSTQYGMRYCGLARPRTGTCEKDAQLICTNPGPVFETIKDQQIVVIWINGIKKLDIKHKQYLSNNLSSCYKQYQNQSQRPNFCTIMSKLPQFKLLSYQDPTIVPPADNYQNFTINNMSTPISTYVHGLVTRPTFNGGPLSWFTSRGQVGLGYFTSEMSNLDIMKSVIRRNGQIHQILMKRYHVMSYNYRIDVYRNRQPPATLMYYDTSISVAKKNLLAGLSGLYIIRDNQIQKNLPNQNYQHHILIHPSAAKTRYLLKTNKQSQNKFQPIAIASSQDYIIYKEILYRFRIANADFMKIYHNLRFIVGSSTQQRQQQQLVEFTIVGTDSSIRKSPFSPVTSIDAIAPAQRFDILIKFDKAINARKVSLAHGDSRQILTVLYLSNQTSSIISTASIPSQISVPFLNYSNYEPMISRRRMRPFSRTADEHIATNGHLTLFQGKSEDPVLGTAEDWYFINNLNSTQSVHIQLISFEAMEQYTLNLVPNSHQCSFYNVDFFMKYGDNCRNDMNISNKVYKPNQFKTFVGETIQQYLQVCKYMEELNKTEYEYCFQNFQNQNDNEGAKHLSGLDVQQICQSNDKSAACTFRYRVEDDKSELYKYRGQQIKLPEYRKGLKQVQIVPKLAYSKLRIRWARGDFPEEQTKQSQRRSQLFFYASEQQMIEYPGYTYRSTLIKGEDSHMLRPIMLQPNPEGKSKTWKQIYQKINGGHFDRHTTRLYTSWHDDEDL